MSVDWKTFIGNSDWNDNFEEQQNKWGYLNNPRWQTSPLPSVNYTGDEENEPQAWSLPGRGYSSGNSVRHIPCGHWHKEIIPISAIPKVYIGDIFNEVQAFTINGALVYKFGSGGTGPGQFTIPGPRGIHIYNDEIYVVDGPGNRVEVFDLLGNFVRQIGSAGTGNGYFDSLRDVYVYNDYVYTVEADVQTPPYGVRVQKWSLSGSYISSFKPPDRGLGSANCLTVLGNRIYVSTIEVCSYTLNFSGDWPTLGTVVDYFNPGWANSAVQLVAYNGSIYAACGASDVKNLTQKLAFVSQFDALSVQGLDVYDDEVFTICSSEDTVRVYSLTGALKREWMIHTEKHVYSAKYGLRVY